MRTGSCVAACVFGAVALPLLCGAQPMFVVHEVGLRGPEFTNPTNGSRNAWFEQFYPGVVAGTSASQDGLFSQRAWVVPEGSWDTIPLALLGPPHVSSRGTTISNFNETQYGLDAGGCLFGFSMRYAGDQQDGRTQWRFDLSSRTLLPIGLLDSDHFSATGRHNSQFVARNSAGDAIGTTSRWSGTLNAGTSAWVLTHAAQTCTRIGLIDPPHVSQVGLAVRESTPRVLLDSGTVVGVSALYHQATLPPGQSVWVYRPADGQTRRLGLLDALHVDASGYHFSEIERVSRSGWVAGTTSRYVGGQFAGTSVWLCDPASDRCVRLGLTGAAYTSQTGVQTSGVSLLLEDGRLGGWSAVYNGGSYAAGATGWVYDPRVGLLSEVGRDPAPAPGRRWDARPEFACETDLWLGPSIARNAQGYGYDTPWVGVVGQAAQPLGLFDARYAGTYGFSGELAAVDQGFVLGRSSFGSSTWTTPWVWDPATGVTRTLGLFSPDLIGSNGLSDSDFDDAAIWNGIVAGISRRPGGSASSAWLADLRTGVTRRVGLNDPLHTAPDGTFGSVLSRSSNGRYWHGISTRYVSGVQRGTTAFILDATTWEYAPIDLSVGESGSAASRVSCVGPDGLALGKFDDYSVSDPPTTTAGFVWTPEFGASRLDAVTLGGFESAGRRLGPPGSGGGFSRVRENIYSVWAQGSTSYSADLLVLERRPRCNADYNEDGNIDQDDVRSLVDVIAGGPNPSGRDPDFNGDGSADQNDVSAVVNTIAGGGCP